MFTVHLTDPSLGNKISLMRLPSIRCVFFAALLVFALCEARADLNDEAVHRCINEVGEFGSGMVQTCVEQDLAAAKALAAYPREAREAVARCTDRLQGRGWSMVKGCVDRDVEAAAVLSGYAKEHAALVEQCQQQMAELGAAKVKECVERELSPTGKQ